MPKRKRMSFFVVAGFFAGSVVSWACMAKAISNIELVRRADLIVRAKAVKCAKAPSDPNGSTTGVPDSEVRFEQLEIIRGAGVAEIVLPGYLVRRDDFNDQQAPYTFVRPGGQAGSCFANSYRLGAQYLLFLEKGKTGTITVNWAALAPVNEQLRSDDDPWLTWVRDQAQRLEKNRKAE